MGFCAEVAGPLPNSITESCLRTQGERWNGTGGLFKVPSVRLCYSSFYVEKSLNPKTNHWLNKKDLKTRLCEVLGNVLKATALQQA